MLPQSEFDSPMLASAQAPVAIAAITQDRALIGLLRSVVDPTTELILVTSEAELVPHLNSRRVSVALLDSMFIEGDLAALAERLRETWSDLVLVVVGTAEEQSKVASQITSGVVYRFLHRPVSAPRVRLFVEAALRRHEVENVERTLEHERPDFSKFEAPKSESGGARSKSSIFIALGGLALAAVTIGAWYKFSGSKSPGEPQAAQVVSSEPTAESAAAPPADEPPADAPAAVAEPVAPAPAPAPAQEPTRSVADNLRQAESSTPPAATQAPTPAPAASVAAAPPAPVLKTIESAVEAAPPAPPPPVPLTHEQRLQEKLAQAEAALQRGELARPAGRSAVELFRGALELDPDNKLAKAGLVRVADRLLTSAERTVTAGNPDEAKKMVELAESLTGPTQRGAFVMMQIEKEYERAAITAKRDSDAANKQEKGATYLRLAIARMRSGALIDPPQDNARFYLEAARQTVPDDPALAQATRDLQKELLTRASAAASAGNAAETERWLANADVMGEARRQEMTNIRRMLTETQLGARADKVTTLTESFNTAMSGGRLLQPAEGSAKFYLFELIKTDPQNAAVARARQSLGQVYVREARSAIQRSDIAGADGWLDEAHTISFAGAELNAVTSELAAAREEIERRSSVVGANSLARVYYVAPKFPASTRGRSMSGWVELEFTVLTDGKTGNVVVTNSSPRKTFDNAAVAAVQQWRYEPVVRGGKVVEQRAAVRIRFTEE
jgi:TonB family protein